MESDVLIRGILLQRACQQVEVRGLTTICWNNTGLKVRHNVSAVKILSRCKPKWMSRQNG